MAMARQLCAVNLWYRLVLQFSAFVLVLLVLEPTPVVSNTYHAAPGLARLAAMDNTLSKQRIKRRIGGLDVTTGAVEYMEKLREKLVNPGQADNESDATNVWCILDKDLVDNGYRPKSRSQRCTTVNHYIYSLKAITESDEVYKRPFSKSIIRAYLQVIPRLLKSYPIKVNITITAKLQNQDSSQYVFAGQHEIDVTARSNGWVELNVTEGVNKLWPLVVNSTGENCNIDFVIKLEVDCKKTKKVPANFVEPTSIKLTQTKRRQRHTALQALLLVYVNDEEKKEIMRQESEQINHNMADSQEESRLRTSRSVGSSAPNICQREDFLIEFSDLQLYYILAPVIYNAYRCSGSCSHGVLRDNDHLGTNHAKLMASAKLIHDNVKNKTISSYKPRDPCCTPTNYDTLLLLLSRGDGTLEIVPYPSMIVTECGCR